MRLTTALLSGLMACGSDGSTSVVTTAGDGGTQGDGGSASDGREDDGSGGNPAASETGADARLPQPSPTCVPPESAPSTAAPTTVVGTGAGTCSEALLVAAVAKAGIITFNCGDKATIAVTKALTLRTDVDTILDGGGKVTLDGGGKTQIMSFNHLDYRKNDVKLTVMRITVAHGKVSGTDPYAAAPSPCSQGYYDGYGGALFVRDGVVLIVDTVFDGNIAEARGPDVGGGALSLQEVKKATVIGSTFKNGAASNGGGIVSLNSELDVYNSVFENNAATGSGANSDDATKCSVVARDGQHQVGSGGNGGAVMIDGGADLTHTFCGVVFRGNQAGAQALAGAIGRTPDGAKQTTIIDRCVFDGNQATAGGGGALYFHNSNLQILATTLRANKAQGCGGIQADGTTIDFLNDTFEANEATGMGGVGGAMCLFGGDGKMRNVTFANGKAEGFGAAVFGGPTLAVDNTLFSNNTANNAGAPMQCQMTATGSANLQFPPNHAIGGAPDSACTTGITFADPLLASLGANGGPTPTMLPGAGSPALRLGKACPATDQRGTARPADACTSGAVEGTK